MRININELEIDQLIKTHMAGWAMLDLSFSNLSDATLTMLARNEELEKIQLLYLNNTNIGDDGIKALARSKHIKNIILFDVSVNHKISDEARKCLMESVFFNSRATIHFTKSKAA